MVRVMLLSQVGQDISENFLPFQTRKGYKPR